MSEHNKRLLSDEEFSLPTTDAELKQYTSEGEMLLGRQDTKTREITLKEIGEWLEKVDYMVLAKDIDQFKQGKMPE